MHLGPAGILGLDRGILSPGRKPEREQHQESANAPEIAEETVHDSHSRIGVHARCRKRST
jgi:hypothetical protein